MLLLQISIYIAKEDVDTYLAALRPCWELVTAEPECFYFDLFQTTDPTDAGVVIFNLVEVWNATLEWMTDIQAKKTYYEPYLKITTPLWKKDREAKVSQQSDGWLSVREQYLATARRD